MVSHLFDMTYENVFNFESLSPTANNTSQWPTQHIHHISSNLGNLASRGPCWMLPMPFLISMPGVGVWISTRTRLNGCRCSPRDNWTLMEAKLVQAASYWTFKALLGLVQKSGC